MHAIARRGPQVAIGIGADAVRAAGCDGMEHLAPRQLCAIDIKDADVLRIGVEHPAGVGDIQAGFVGRKGQPVRTVKIAEHGIDPARGINPVDLTGQFLFGLEPFVIGGDPVMGVGEPDRAVRFDDNVVWRVQGFAVKAVGNHRDGSVEFCPGDAPCAMFAGQQPALTVARVPVGIVRRASESRQARARCPAQDAVVRNVGKQQTVGIAEPHRAFGPVKAGGELFDRGIAHDKGAKTRIGGFEEGHLVLLSGGRLSGALAAKTASAFIR